MDDTARELVVDLSRALEAHDKRRAGEAARMLDLALEGESSPELASLRLLARSFSIFLRTSTTPPPPPPRATRAAAPDPFAEFGTPDVRTYATSKEGPISWRSINQVLRSHHRPSIWHFHGIADTTQGPRHVWGLIYAETRASAEEYARNVTEGAFFGSPDFLRVASVDVRHPGEGLEEG